MDLGEKEAQPANKVNGQTKLRVLALVHSKESDLFFSKTHVEPPKPTYVDQSGKKRFFTDSFTWRTSTLALLSKYSGRDGRTMGRFHLSNSGGRTDNASFKHNLTMKRKPGFNLHGEDGYKEFQDLILSEKCVECSVVITAHTISIRTESWADYYLAKSVVKPRTSLEIVRG